MNLFIQQFLLFTFSTFFIITTIPKIFLNEYSLIIVGFLMMFVQLSNLILNIILSKFTFKGKYLSFIYFLFFINNLILYFFINNLIITIISFLLFSIFYNLIFTYNDSMILEKHKHKYGIYRSIGSSFFVLMSIFSYFFIKDYNILFILMVFSSLLLFLNSFSLAKSTIKIHQDIKIKKENILNEKYLFIFSIIFNISIAMYFSFYSIFLTKFGYSINQVFIIFGISVIAETIMLIFQHNIINKNKFLNVYNLIIFSIFMTVIRFILIQMFPLSFIIQICANILHLFTFSLFFSSMLLYLKEKYPSTHFIYSTLYRGIGFGIGGTIGALLSGIIYKYYGIYYFYVPATLSFISIYFLLKLKKENIK